MNESNIEYLKNNFEYKENEDGTYTITGLQNNLLTEIVIPDGVTNIESGAFRKAGLLENLILADSVKVIDKGAFVGCFHLKKVTLPKRLTEIPEMLFANTNIQNIIIPNSVKVIGKGAFCFCDRLENVVLPKKLTYIADGLFANCEILRSINIPSGITYIGKKAFYDCKNLKVINFEGKKAQWKSIVANYDCKDYLEYHCDICCSDGTIKALFKNKFYYKNNKDGTLTITGLKDKSLTDIVIPDGVTHISKNAFIFSDLKNIILPETLRRIGDNAFEFFKGEQIILPKYINYIGKNSFAQSNLTDITFNNDVHIYDYAFFNSENLKCVTLNNYQKIGKDAFECCNNLKQVYFDGNIKDWCDSYTSKYFLSSPLCNGADLYLKLSPEDDYKCLTNLIIPNDVCIIEENTFLGCKNIKTADLKNGITSIGDSAFRLCENLTEITLPDSIILIDSYAFADSTNLKDIIFNGTKKNWNDVIKKFEWNRNIEECTVHCSDGDIVEHYTKNEE